MKNNFKRTLCVAFSALTVGVCLTILSSINSKSAMICSISADEAEFESYEGVVATEAAPVYKSPEFDFRNVKYKDKGEKLTIYEEKNGYGKISSNPEEWVDLRFISYNAKVTAQSESVDLFSGSGSKIGTISSGETVTIYQEYNGLGRITDTKYNVVTLWGYLNPCCYYGEWISLDSIDKITINSVDDSNDNKTTKYPQSFFKVVSTNGISVKDKNGNVINNIPYGEIIPIYDEKIEHEIPYGKIKPNADEWICLYYTEKIGHMEFKPLQQDDDGKYCNLRICDQCGVTIAGSGCGPMSVVNSVGYLTGVQMNIDNVADIVCKERLHHHNGRYRGCEYSVVSRLAENFGSTYGFKFVSSRYFGTQEIFPDSRKDYPVQNEYDSVWNEMISHLENGEVAVTLVEKHFIAIVAYDRASNSVLVYDSQVSWSKGTTTNGDWKTYDELNGNNLGEGDKKLKLRKFIAFLSRT